VFFKKIIKFSFCITCAHLNYTNKRLSKLPEGVLRMREGMIPAVLGTVVSASGAVLLSSKYKLAATGILGFGLAHVVLGAIDLIEHR
jgi:hypothetical protein